MYAPATKSGWKQDAFFALLLIAATLLAYQPAWKGGPVFDDEDHLTPPELASLDGLARIWTQLGAVSQYYPVTHSAFWLQHYLWGDAMPGYHLLNILLHAFSALLLVRILQRLEVPGAWLAAALFALHPVHVESVAWISELKNTLSGIFYLSAALAYLKFDRTRHAKFYLAALALFALGLLSKSVVASLPAALLVVFWWRRGRLSWKEDVRPLLPFFAAAIVAGLFTAWVERKFIGAEGDAFALGPMERTLVAGRALWFYLGKLCWPADLVFIYPRWQINPSVWWQSVFPLAAVALLAAVWGVRRRWRGPLAGWLFFAGTLVPVLGFLNVYPFLYSFVADHYQYLASLGVIVPTAAGVALLLGRWQWWGRPAGNVFCVAVLAVLAGLTWRQSRMYAGVETLWRTTIARNPACWAAYSNLGNYLLQIGQVDEAIRLCEKAQELRPGSAEVHNNLGNALRQKGQVEAALGQYQTALAIRPNLAAAHFNVGAIRLEQGRTREAAASFQKAVELRPEFVKARNNFGSLLLDEGRVDEAIVHFQKALSVRPDDPDAHNNLGNALLRLGRLDDAIAHYQTALASAPDNANAQCNYGSACLQKGRVDEAIARFQQAIKLQPNFAVAHANLGHALLQKGQVEEAKSHYQKALQILPDDGMAHYNYGFILLQQGELDDAIAHLRKAVALQPALPSAHNDLGVALAQKGSGEEAAGCFRQALGLQTDFAEAHNNLGKILQQKGEVVEAVAHYRAALKVQPDDPDTLSNLAWVMATSPEASLRNGDQAVTLAQRANQLSGDEQPVMLRTLAAAYAEAGRFAEASAQARRALQFAQAQSDAALARDLRVQLGRYEASAPFRDQP